MGFKFPTLIETSVLWRRKIGKKTASCKNHTRSHIRVHKSHPISDQKSSKTIPFGATHTYIAHIKEYPSPWDITSRTSLAQLTREELPNPGFQPMCRVPICVAGRTSTRLFLNRRKNRSKSRRFGPRSGDSRLRTVPPFVTAHTFCASRDIRVS